MDKNVEAMERKLWEMIDQANKMASPNYQDTQSLYCRMLESQIMELSRDEILTIDAIYRQYHHLANTNALWDAASDICWTSDDGFTDFRYWLINQGKQVYLDCLKNPDNLHRIDIGKYSGEPWHIHFESIGYVVGDAFNKKFGEDYYDVIETESVELDPEAFQSQITYFDKSKLTGYAFLDYPNLHQKYYPASKSMSAKDHAKFCIIQYRHEKQYVKESHTPAGLAGMYIQKYGQCAFAEYKKRPETDKARHDSMIRLFSLCGYSKPEKMKVPDRNAR